MKPGDLAAGAALCHLAFKKPEPRSDAHGQASSECVAFLNVIYLLGGVQRTPKRTPPFFWGHLSGIAKCQSESPFLFVQLDLIAWGQKSQLALGTTASLVLAVPFFGMIDTSQL